MGVLAARSPVLPTCQGVINEAAGGDHCTPMLLPSSESAQQPDLAPGDLIEVAVWPTDEVLLQLCHGLFPGGIVQVPVSALAGAVNDAGVVGGQVNLEVRDRDLWRCPPGVHRRGTACPTKGRETEGETNQQCRVCQPAAKEISLMNAMFRFFTTGLMNGSTNDRMKRFSCPTVSASRSRLASMASRWATAL